MSGETLEENEAAENALAEVEKINSEPKESKSEEPLSDAQLENEEGKTVEVENEKPEETHNEGEEKVLTDGDGENTKVSETNGDHMLDEDPYTSEDDEEDDLWVYDDGEGDGVDDSDEGDEEETAFDEDEPSEEEDATEDGDNEDNPEGDGEETAFGNYGVNEGEAIEEEDDVEDAEAGKDIAEEDGEGAEERNAEKAEVNLKKKRRVKKSKGWGEINKLSEETSQKVADGENSKSSKKKSKKKVESMGMIFMCSSKTKSDCFKYKVLGLPESKKDVVEKIYSGMRLFLYDVDLKLMYGIYKAQGPGGYNIERKAFKSKFPSQVRFSILRDCLPLAEEKFKKVIKENYFTNKKFDGQLNSEQVKRLCKLFVSISKGTPTKRLPRSRKAEKQPITVRRESRRAEKQPITVRRESKRKQRVDDRKHPPLRERTRQMERPPKRPRRAISPVSRSRQAPLATAPLIALDRNLDVDPYRRDLYLDSRDRDHYLRGSYESRRDRPIEYRQERDLYLERRDPYRDGRDSYLDRRDPYRDGRDLILDRRAPNTETLDPYPDRRTRYRDEPDPYPVSRDPYRDAQDVYITRPVYKDVREPELYDPYRREPLPDGRVVYREDRGVAYRDPYRLEEVLDRPLSLESRRRYDSVNQDPYVSYRAIPSTTLPLYTAEYTSRGLTREYQYRL